MRLFRRLNNEEYIVMVTHSRMMRTMPEELSSFLMEKCDEILREAVFVVGGVEVGSREVGNLVDNRTCGWI